MKTNVYCSRCKATREFVHIELWIWSCILCEYKVELLNTDEIIVSLQKEKCNNDKKDIPI